MNKIIKTEPEENILLNENDSSSNSSSNNNNKNNNKNELQITNYSFFDK